jgi:hypothetical protein
MTMIECRRWDGKTITVPGIYSDVPMKDYHRGDICAGPGTSSSGLRGIRRSAAHYWDTSPLNPNRNDADDDKESFVLGRAAHHLICGQAFFAAEFVIQPATLDGEPWQGGRKLCKTWKAARKREGKTVLTEAQVEAVKGMAIALGKNPLVQAGILNGLIERSMFWQDAETGLWLKARPDAMPSDSGDFADLKTTVSVQYIDLQRTLDDYGYHMQGALVLEGAAALGIEAASFTDVFVEKKRPHCVWPLTIIDEDIALGARENRVAMRLLADCLSSGRWPGPGNDGTDAGYIQLSDRARERAEARLKFEMQAAT